MGYQIRVFCAADEIPPLEKMRQWLHSRNVPVQVNGAAGPANLESSDWKSAALVYKPGKEPIGITCLRETGGDDSPLRQSVQQFLDRIGAPGKSQSKRRVTSHLKATRYAILLDLPTWDMDDAGYDANGQILTFLGEQCGGLVYADKEGFYDGDKLILSLE